MKLQTYINSILSLLMALMPSAGFCQSSDRNYVRTQTMLNGQGTKIKTEIQYYDALGRPDLYVTNGMGHSGNYTYLLTTYNQAGLPRRVYRPLAGSISGGYLDETGITGLLNTTYSDIDAFSHSTYDALGREVSTVSPGEEWHDYDLGIYTSHQTNAANSVRRYIAEDEPGSLVDLHAFYPAGTLYAEQTTDEDGHAVTIFTDRMQRKVLERRQDSLDTYFVYNTVGRLRFVLTPEYQKSGHKDRLAYEYRYNNRGLVDKKILPHCEYIQYWYDRHDRLVSMQDANLRERGRCRFYLYDQQGRIAIQGTCDNFNYNNPCIVTRSSASGWLGTGYDYDSQYGVSHPMLEIVSHYDDYTFLSASLFAQAATQLTVSAAQSAKGLPTGTYTRSSARTATLSATYYDQRGNPIQTRQWSADGLRKYTARSFSHTDKPLTESATVYLGNAHATVSKTYTYHDYSDQLASVAVACNNGTPVTVAAYEYNDIGQLKKLTRGGSAGSVSYKYNVRGWLTEITSNDFSEWLHYTDGVGTPYYSGNISSQLWKAGSESFKRGYRFDYDLFGRMVRGIYGEGDNLAAHGGRYTETLLEYTLNGSPRKIERYGKKSDGNYGKIDNLRLYYNCMQVDSVKEDALPVTYAGAFDFVARTATGIGGKQYAYYGDGSLMWDANKGIAMIEYDWTCRPKRVQFTNGNVTEYDYAPDGHRRKVVYRTAVPNISVPVGSTLTMNAANTLAADSIVYAGEFIFENGQLGKYLFEGGYATFAGGQPAYHYYTCDHLGNNRTVVSHGGSLEQVNHYYPFGAVYSDAGMNDALQRYKYNGKELDRMHGMNLYDYGARSYDPLLCRFTQTDRFSDKYPWVNPYGLCGNNPVNMVDVNGDSIMIDSKSLAAIYAGIENGTNLYLQGLPSSHGRPGVNPFVYGRSSMMSKRLGYDY